MEKENVGVFSIELNIETGKYNIVYIEKGEKIIIEGEEYIFDTYNEAEDYVKNNKDALNEYVTKYKESLTKDEDGVDNTQDDTDTSDNGDEEDKTDEEEKIEDDSKDKKKKNSTVATSIISILLTIAMLVGGHFIAKGISSSIKDSKDEPSIDNSQTITKPNVQTKPLTTDEFEKLATDFTKLYADKNLNVSTEDLVKFVSIVNIDRLVEDNPELASQLFDSQSKEEYLNDAAKVIGLTYTYNRNIYQQTGKTDGFIKISDAVYGEQKSALQTVETYVDLIAAYNYSVEEANLYITSLIRDLGDPTSELAYLDDGVGFGMQVSIELIRSCIAKDVINQKNLDALTLLTSSEEYISNIFAVYDKCTPSNTKTRK